MQLKQDSIQITVTDNRISVVNAPVGSKLEIFSVVGLKVREIEMKQPSGEYLVNISKGYYIIRIEEIRSESSHQIILFRLPYCIQLNYCFRNPEENERQHREYLQTTCHH